VRYTATLAPDVSRRTLAFGTGAPDGSRTVPVIGAPGWVAAPRLMRMKSSVDNALYSNPRRSTGGEN
jgi:hypothetical protein